MLPKLDYGGICTMDRGLGKKWLSLYQRLMRSSFDSKELGKFDWIQGDEENLMEDSEKSAYLGEIT